MVGPLNALLGVTGLYFAAGTANTAAIIYKNRKIASMESRINACVTPVDHSDHLGIITCRSALSSTIPHKKTFRAKYGVYCGQCTHDYESISILRKESFKLDSYNRFFLPWVLYKKIVLSV